MLKSGFAHADISPPLTGKPSGSYMPRVMTGVHDPLLAVACVIDDGVTPLALVGIDAGVIVREHADLARQLIEQQTGIPRGNVIISASHTHQGGPVVSVFRTEANPDYGIKVAHGVADAVARAWKHRSDAEIGSGFGKVTGIHFNRRFLMRDGREVTHPGKMHADIVRPAGPVDERVGVLALRDRAQKITGVVVNFGCHCTVTEDGHEYSADYVYYLREHLKRLLGPIEVVFLLGACGDVTQIDNQSRTVEKGHPHADMMGTTIAAEAARVIQRIKWHDSAACGVANHATPIAIRDRDYSDPPTRGLGSGDYWDPVYARETNLVTEMRSQSPTRDVQITAMKIADLALVANGAELFAQPALGIQQASPHPQTWVITLANEYVGYVPTASAHYAGGYEPRLARSSFLAPDAAQKIVETSLRALRELAKAP